MKSFSRLRAMCDWTDFPDGARSMRTHLADGDAGLLPPFLSLNEPGLSGQDHRRCADLWMHDRKQAAQAECGRLAFDFNRPANPILRIGYLSNDFHDHATLLLLIELLEANDTARHQIYAYSYGKDDGKALRKRALDAFHIFRDISDLTDAEAAQRIFDDRIDILVDIKGFTQNTRTSILLLRPAPIQVNYLGYPGTLGGSLCDYIITDAYVTPTRMSGDYAESFAYMPHSYQPHGRAGPLSPHPDRADLGLPAKGFVFCCFNQAFKFTPEVFGQWCRLLSLVPDSVLWLLTSAQAEGNLRNEALRHGIGAHRLIFAPDMGQSDHLNRLQLADLVLDTSPYGAHTTASDALCMGVPVITREGDTFAARVAGSLLGAVGLAELIAPDADAYMDLAYDLATDPERMAQVRGKLARNRDTAPLFDVDRYAIDLGALFDAMWERHAHGLPAAAIGAKP
jgi:predicted O-linked N-acetylglucosamine transferase (SPINDLY family)